MFRCRYWRNKLLVFVHLPDTMNTAVLYAIAATIAATALFEQPSRRSLQKRGRNG